MSCIIIKGWRLTAFINLFYKVNTILKYRKQVLHVTMVFITSVSDRFGISI